jgi:hypothetical protein
MHAGFIAQAMLRFHELSLGLAVLITVFRDTHVWRGNKKTPAELTAGVQFGMFMPLATDRCRVTDQSARGHDFSQREELRTVVT